MYDPFELPWRLWSTHALLTETDGTALVGHSGPSTSNAPISSGVLGSVVVHNEEAVLDHERVSARPFHFKVMLEAAVKPPDWRGVCAIGGGVARSDTNFSLSGGVVSVVVLPRRHQVLEDDFSFRLFR